MRLFSPNIHRIGHPGGEPYSDRAPDSLLIRLRLAGLDPGHRRLLGWISVLGGAIDWPTIDAINPFRGDPPEAVRPAVRSSKVSKKRSDSRTIRHVSGVE